MKTARREREIQRTREDILEAAARAFARSGYGAATMRDIAREAGYTAPSLYTYFASKEAILEGFVELVSTEFARTFDEPVPPGLTFEQRLVLLIARQLEHAERRRELFASLFSTYRAPRQAGDELRDPLGYRVRLFARWLRANATAADLGGYDIQVAARFLVGVTFAYLYGWVAEKRASRLSDRAAEVVGLFLRGLTGAGHAAIETRPAKKARGR